MCAWPAPCVWIAVGSQTMTRIRTPACISRKSSPSAVSSSGTSGYGCAVQALTLPERSRCALSRQPEM